MKKLILFMFVLIACNPIKQEVKECIINNCKTEAIPVNKINGYYGGTLICYSANEIIIHDTLFRIYNEEIKGYELITYSGNNKKFIYINKIEGSFKFIDSVKCLEYNKAVNAIKEINNQKIISDKQLKKLNKKRCN